jgi:proline iminopeptidase
MACPLDTARDLARAWPSVELIVLDDAGHLRSDSERAALFRTLN